MRERAIRPTIPQSIICEDLGGIAQRSAPANADAMSSLAAGSFGISASVIRPTSPYLKVPPLAHSTTSPMACFLVEATALLAGFPLFYRLVAGIPVPSENLLAPLQFD